MFHPVDGSKRRYLETDIVPTKTLSRSNPNNIDLLDKRYSSVYYDERYHLNGLTLSHGRDVI